MSNNTPTKATISFVIISILVSTFPLLLNLVALYMKSDGLDKSTDLVLVTIYYVISVLNYISFSIYYVISVIGITTYLIWCVTDKGEK